MGFAASEFKRSVTWCDAQGDPKPVGGAGRVEGAEREHSREMFYVRSYDYVQFEISQANALGEGEAGGSLCEGF